VALLAGGVGEEALVSEGLSGSPGGVSAGNRPVLRLRAEPVNAGERVELLLPFELPEFPEFPEPLVDDTVTRLIASRRTWYTVPVRGRERRLIWSLSGRRYRKRALVG